MMQFGPRIATITSSRSSSKAELVMFNIKWAVIEIFKMSLDSTNSLSALQHFSFSFPFNFKLQYVVS